MRFPPSHPMTIAWNVIRQQATFCELAAWPDVQRDTAITVALDGFRETWKWRFRAKAVSILAELEDNAAKETCDFLLETSTSSLVRQAAISSLRPTNLLLRRLRFDPSYLVRMLVLKVLPDSTPIDDLRIAADDPHWRVRNALLQIIESRSLLDHVADWKSTYREAGLIEFARWRKLRERSPATTATHRSSTHESKWDADPAVLVARLKRSPRNEWLTQLPKLIHHDDERVRSWAVGQLLEFGTAELCADAATNAEDPRHPGWWCVDSLVNRLPSKRRPDWKPVEPSVSDWSAEHPMRRKCSDLASETCWLVLNKYLQGQGMWPEQLLPNTLASKAKARVEVITLAARDPQTRRLAVSGHYLLPSEQFGHAFEQGIDSYFWEPNYGTFNHFMNRLSRADRQRLRMITGTFEAEPRKIIKEIDQSLRTLKVEQLDTFLLFWTRSPQRFSEEVLRVLERMKNEGKVAMCGLSTHQWQLAREQIDAGWNPVMVRHNLAHRSAETRVLPAARERETRILSFNSTCYGRLIDAGISARNCIRYSLLQNEIDLVLTAPATAEQLHENLSALAMPLPTSDEVAYWRAIGDQVYADNKAFQRGLQSR